MRPVWWTVLDESESDILVHELALGFIEHRQRCQACSPDPCPVFVAWNAHLAECVGCRGDAPLSHPACPGRRAEFVAHGETCVRCNVCSSVSLAIDIVLQWRESRELLSKSEWLRAERVEGAA